MANRTREIRELTLKVCCSLTFHCWKVWVRPRPHVLHLADSHSRHARSLALVNLVRLLDSRASRNVVLESTHRGSYKLPREGPSTGERD